VHEIEVPRVNSSNARNSQRIQMISAETMFYFSASIQLGSKSRIVLKQRKRIQRCFESRLKARGAPSGETLVIAVSLWPSPPEIHL
jgi:hypothetical protein